MSPCGPAKLIDELLSLGQAYPCANSAIENAIHLSGISSLETEVQVDIEHIKMPLETRLCS